jgi:hypothetical protein
MAEKVSFHPFGDCDSEAPELADQGAFGTTTIGTYRT